METHSNKGLLDIKSIIQFGNRKSEDYQVLFYKEKYDKIFNVRIRALSSFEYDEIEIDMFDDIKDQATIKFVFNLGNEPEEEDKLSEPEKAFVEVVIGKELSDNEEKPKKKKKTSIFDRKLPEGVDISKILKAYAIRDVLIVYKGMKDFYNDLTIKHVKQMEGINEIAKRIDTKSGRTKEVTEDIEFFREEQGQHETKVSSIDGPHPM